MFWLMRLRVFEPPMPPIPTVATLTVSLGAWNPLPSTWRGTIVRPAPVAGTGVTHFRLVMPSFMIFPLQTLNIAKAHWHDGPAGVNSVPFLCWRLVLCGWCWRSVRVLMRTLTVAFSVSFLLGRCASPLAAAEELSLKTVLGRAATYALE